MDQGLREFARRHRDIQRKHRRLAQGYITRLGRNGVIEHRPRREVAPYVATPLAILVIAFFGFKVMMLSSLGVESYERHVAALAAGNGAERVGAVLMARDPLTQAITNAVQMLN